MNFVLRALIGSLFVLSTVACSGDANSNPNGVRSPIAHERVLSNLDYAEVLERLQAYSAENSFAVQNLDVDRGFLVEFSITLFRDDVKITIARLRNEPIDVAAYSLCSCEADQPRVLAAGRAAVEEIATVLAS